MRTAQNPLVLATLTVLGLSIRTSAFLTHSRGTASAPPGLSVWTAAAGTVNYLGKTSAMILLGPVFRREHVNKETAQTQPIQHNQVIYSLLLPSWTH